MKKPICLFTILLLGALFSFPQSSKLDSLQGVLTTKIHDTIRIQTLLDIGYFFENSNPDSAMYYYSKSLDLSKSKKLKKQMVNSLNYIGLLQIDLGNYTEAKVNLEESLSISRGINDKNSIADAYINLGNLEFYLGNYQNVTKNYLKAKDIYEDLKNNEGLSRIYNNLGVVSINTGDYSGALNYYNKSVDIDQELGDKKGVSKSLNNIGNVHYYLGNYSNAIEFFEKSLSISLEIDDKSGISGCYLNIGSIYDEQGNYQAALENYFKTLKIDEELGNKHGMIQVYNSIGLVFKSMKEYNRGLEYFNKSLEIGEAISDLRGSSYALNNIGLCYVEMASEVVNRNTKNDLFLKALNFFTKSMEINLQMDNKRGVSASYNNMGMVYQHLGDYKKAIESYQHALDINAEIGAVSGIGTASINIATLYTTLADSTAKSKSEKQSYYNKAYDYSMRAYKFSVEGNTLPLMSSASKNLMTLNKKQGKFQNALKFAEIYISTRDSMFREEKTKAITEMQTKYETEKKQQEIEKQQLVIEKQEVENRRQRNIRNFFIAGSLLLALLAFAIFRGYQQKKRSNAIITEKNVLLEQANEEIAAQRDLVTEQKEHIETIHEELTSSIRYAKRIQGAVLPAPNQMEELLRDHFILFKPKDIVSGDFYWATKVRQWLIFCVADCTGHGVPGAFMSMLGVSFLNDIVHKENVTSASEVLNHLRTSIIGALKQLGDGSEQKDGMDMGLCVIDIETRKMQFAGGYNPCWIVPNPEIADPRIIEPKGEEDSAEPSNVIQLKPDKMPIAIHKHMEPFTNHLVQLYPGDQVYLMSDGFQDQFGGPQGKKFMVKNLRELLVANASLPMHQQCEALERTLEDWKNGAEQVDDVTILGFRLA